MDRTKWDSKWKWRWLDLVTLKLSKVDLAPICLVIALSPWKVVSDNLATYSNSFRTCSGSCSGRTDSHESRHPTERFQNHHQDVLRGLAGAHQAQENQVQVTTLSNLTFVLKMDQPRPLFTFIFSLFKQTTQFLQQINVKNVMSIQYLPPGFKPMTFGTWVSSHNH